MLYIEGYNNYTISPHGEVVNTDTGRVLKTDLNNCGYKRVTLSKGGVTNRFFIHRLVALHYIPNPKGSAQMNHKDGDKDNNFKDNLEWMSCKENHQHAMSSGLRARGEASSNTNLTNDLVKEVCVMMSEGYERKLILRQFPEVTVHMLGDIRRRKTWCHVSKDFIW